MRKVGLCLSGFLVILSIGCGDGLNRQSVKGTVTYKSKLIVIGSATFTPIPVTGPTTISATIRDGKYEVEKASGLSPGKYLVRFSGYDKEVNGPAIPGNGPTPEPPKEILPAKHTMQGREVEVKAGDPNQLDFQLD